METGAAAKRRKDAVVPPKEEGADKKEGLPKTSPNVLLQWEMTVGSIHHRGLGFGHGGG